MFVDVVIIVFFVERFYAQTARRNREETGDRREGET